MSEQQTTGAGATPETTADAPGSAPPETAAVATGEQSTAEEIGILPAQHWVALAEVGRHSTPYDSETKRIRAYRDRIQMQETTRR